jgi:hypothetical protein
MSGRGIITTCRCGGVFPSRTKWAEHVSGCPQARLRWGARRNTLWLADKLSSRRHKTPADLVASAGSLRCTIDAQDGWPLDREPWGRPEPPEVLREPPDPGRCDALLTAARAMPPEGTRHRMVNELLKTLP